MHKENTPRTRFYGAFMLYINRRLYEEKIIGEERFVRVRERISQTEKAL